jgi:anti-sigma factor RsiW
VNRHDETHEPRWLKLAATLHAEPAAGTLARVRQRIAARDAQPAWLLWFARPAALVASAGLLAASAWFGATLVSTRAVSDSSEVSFAAAQLGDDGAFGLSGVETASTGTGGTSGADSGQVRP